MDDIYTLYRFDKMLRDLVFSYSTIIEQKLRSAVSYAFCDKFSNVQAAYLNPANYWNTKKNRYSIHKLINILEYIANSDKEHEYLVYQRKTYGNVPLYAAIFQLSLK